MPTKYNINFVNHKSGQAALCHESVMTTTSRTFRSIIVILSLCVGAFCRIPVPYFPTANTSKTTIGFSWDVSSSDYNYYLQIEDTITGGIVFGAYVYGGTHVVTLYPGMFRWRVEALSDPSTHGGFGPWISFSVLSSTPAAEDLLGVAPTLSSDLHATSLKFPAAASRASDGSVLIADTQHNLIKRLSGGTVSVIAGNGLQGYSGDGVATAVELNLPTAALDDGRGNVFILDAGNYLLREWTPDGQLTTLAGIPGQPGFLNPDKTLVNSALGYAAAATIRSGVLYVAMNFVQFWSGPHEVSVASIFQWTGSSFVPYSPLVNILFEEITGFDTLDGTDWVIDGDGHFGNLYRIAGGVSVLAAENMGFSDGVVAVDANSALAGDWNSVLYYSNSVRTNIGRFLHVSSIFPDGSGGFLVADSDNQSINDITIDGDVVSVVDGSNLPFGNVSNVALLDSTHLAVLTSNPGALYSYDSVTGATVRLLSDLTYPSGMAVGPDGSIYWCQLYSVLRYQPKSGIVSVFAGQEGNYGYSDNTTLDHATFLDPVQLAWDAHGGLLISDEGNNAVRRADPTTGLVTTVALANAPSGLAAYPDGVYVSEYNNNDVLFCFYDTADGAGCTVAVGQPSPASYQGGGAFAEGCRLNALLNSTNGLALITGPELIFADQFNNRIRLAGGYTATLFGDGSEGYGTTSANLPGSVAVLGWNVYFTDNGNGVLRVIAGSVLEDAASQVATCH